MKEKIYIGNLIKEKLKEKDLTLAWLARQVCCNESNFYKKIKKNDLSFDLLFRVSDILHEDFFIHGSRGLSDKWNYLP